MKNNLKSFRFMKNLSLLILGVGVLLGGVVFAIELTTVSTDPLPENKTIGGTLSPDEFNQLMKVVRELQKTTQGISNNSGNDLGDPTDNNIGIGLGPNINPTAKLDVNGDIKASGTICDGDGNCLDLNNVSLWVEGIDDYISRAVGNVGIGTSTPSEKLEVAGNIKAIAYLYSSDKRLKKNIKPIENALEKIQKLEGVEFTWKDSQTKNVGLIAQNVEKIFPELVVTSEIDGMKSVQYGNLVAPLIEAIKTQQSHINALKLEIEVLKRKQVE